uniref:Uncharacterized protein n=1 Tax=Triticum urartu TaxID=4572 RepID=A0A8R7PLS8_TRIUA
MLDVLRCPAPAHVGAQPRVDTFAYHIPIETAEDLLELCKNCSVWKEEGGADEDHVLQVLPMTVGAKATSYTDPAGSPAVSFKSSVGRNC